MNPFRCGRPARNSLRRLSLSASFASFVCLVGGQWLAPRLLGQSGDYQFVTVAGIAAKSGSLDGTGGGTNVPLFDGPTGLVVNSSGNLCVADSHNGLLRVVTPGGVVTTFVGTPGLAGSVDGTGADSGVSFNSPQGPAIDAAGNIYVADVAGATIRKITPAGVVTTVAGTAATTGTTDGTGAAARFLRPGGVAVDTAGNLYVADTGNHTVRKITSAGVVTTLAGTAGTAGSTDGTGTAALFNLPRALATDAAGNIYVADAGNRCIRKVTPAGVVTTFAGSAGVLGADDGAGAAAHFSYPVGLAADAAGNFYVADSGNSTIRKITPGGVVTTLAGSASAAAGLANGTGAAARFKNPTGVAADAAGNVYVADLGNDLVRKITPAGVVTTVVGAGGIAGILDGEGYVLQPSLFNNPSATAADAAGNVYVADTVNNLIRKITPAGVVTTLAGSATSSGHTDGTGLQATFTSPLSLAADPVGNVYVPDTVNQLIRKITPAGVVTTLAGTAGSAGNTNGTKGAATFNHPRGVAVDGSGDVYVADFGNRTIRKIRTDGGVVTLAGSVGNAGTTDGQGSAARFEGPTSVAADAAGDVFVTDANSNTIRMVSAGGLVTTVGGTAGTVGNRDGAGTAARFNNPMGVAVDASGNLFVADSQNHTIRKGWAPGSSPASSGSGGSSSGGSATTGTGTDTSSSYTNGAGGTSATSGTTGSDSSFTITVGTGFFTHPSGVVVDASGNYFVTDTAHHSIKKIDTTLGVTVFAGQDGSSGSADGTGTAARFNGPTGIVIDSSGNLYVCDTGNATIRKITSAGVVTTLAGTAGSRGTQDGTGSAALFTAPTGITLNTTTGNLYSGTLYVTDSVASTIRMVSPAGVVTTFTGTALKSGYADGDAGSALFNNPSGITMDSAQNLYVADTYNNVIRKIPTVDVTTAVIDAGVITVNKVAAGTVSTLAGAAGISGSYDGTGIFSLFNNPTGVSVDASKTVYVADTGNSSIRSITSRGVVTTVAGLSGVSGGRDGAGSQALFNQPQAVLAGTSLMVADTGNSLLRTVTLADDVVSTPALVTGTATTTTTTTTTTTAASSGGGGGAPSLWFGGALSLLGLARGFTRRPGRGRS